MRKILITTDFTDEAAKNINTVLRFLQDASRPVSVLLLNTYLLPRSEPSRVIELNDELKKKSRDGLAAAKKSAIEANTNPLVMIDTASHLGSLNNVVQNLMGVEKYETIAFCESGEEKLSELIRNSAAPLLITCK